MLRLRNLGSGSSGNCTLVEAVADGGAITRLLVDCGLGIRVLERRLGAAGLAFSDLHALFITHEHSDHVGCARALALRQRLPVWMSDGSWRASGSHDYDGLLNVAVSGQPIALDGLQIDPIAVPHDALEPLQLSCTDGNRKLAILTDLGHVPESVLNHLAGSHLLLLECNHEPDLLEASSYPAFLKRRVAGAHGHLANAQAASALHELQHGGLRHVVAAHLSARNNRPELARAALAQSLGAQSGDIVVADPVSGTGWLSA